MIFISLLIFIVAIALPSFKKQLSPILLTRISTIILIYSGALAFNSLYIQSIGSGIGIYSGLFHVSVITQVLDSFLLFIAALILIPRPGILEHSNNTAGFIVGGQPNFLDQGRGGQTASSSPCLPLPLPPASEGGARQGGGARLRQGGTVPQRSMLRGRRQRGVLRSHSRGGASLRLFYLITS